VKIESRILSSIKHRPGAVVLRRDVAGLGSASQVSESLKALQMNGVIVRVGEGIYAKSIKDPSTGAVMLTASAEDIAIEAFQKLLGVVVRVVRNESSNNVDSLTLDTGSHRINRWLSIGGKSVVYFHQQSNKRRVSLTSPLQIPQEGVSRFVERLARKHKITYVRTAGDEWAETVTRLADDDVRSDDTGDLLVALKRAHKLTDREMTALLVNHLREKRRVRSL
jgi:hypothetical protein